MLLWLSVLLVLKVGAVTHIYNDTKTSQTGHSNITHHLVVRDVGYSRNRSQNLTVGPEHPCGYCSILISEVQTDGLAENNQQQFIELQVLFTRRGGKVPRLALNGFHLIIVRGSTQSVVLHINLSKLSFRMTTSGPFFVVGSSGIQNNDLLLTDEVIESVFINSVNTPHFPLGDDSPYGIILLFSTSVVDLKRFTLHRVNGVYREIQLTEALKRIIRSTAQDIVVYARKSPAARCTVFEQIWPNDMLVKSGLNYVLRNWNFQTSLTERHSINRCTPEVSPFLPQNFQRDVESPGNVNPCKGAFIFMEDVIPDVTPLVPPGPEESGDAFTTPCSSNDVNIPQSRFTQATDEAVQAAVAEAMKQAEHSCVQQQVGDLDFIDFEASINFNNELTNRANEIPLTPFMIDYRFNSDWIDQGKPYVSNNAEILRDKSVQQWLELDFTSKNHPVVFKCAHCNSLFEHGFRLDIRRRVSFATKEGYFNTVPSLNTFYIKEHMKNDVHISTMRALYRYGSSASGEEAMLALKDYEAQEEELYKPTSNMIRTVYAEVLAEVSFNHHKMFVDLQKFHGVNLGMHHYTRTAAATITKVISETIHNILLNFLISEQNPFALIVDASTDKRNVPYLITYFQTLEAGFPHVYLYRLVSLPNGESAEAQFNSFWDAVEGDNTLVSGFMDYVINKIAVFVSDGAAVMIGKNKSFFVNLKNKIKRDIPNIQCMAHQAALSIKRALSLSKNPRFELFQTFEKSLNGFYNFYMSRGSKRWQHLANIAIAHGLVVKRIKKLIEIRWASSEYVVVDTLTADEEALDKDLKSISSDSTFTTSAQQQAATLHSFITDIQATLVRYEFLDFLSIYKGLFMDFQKLSGLLLDKYDSIAKAITQFTTLKSEPGSRLSKFISQCSCENVCELSLCTIVEVENCPEVLYKTMKLKPNIERQHKLSELREELYTAIISEVEKYFNIDKLDAFKIFDQRRYHLADCNTNPKYSSNIVQNNNYNIEASEDDLFYNATARYERFLKRINMTSLYASTNDKEKFKIICTMYFIPEDDCHILYDEWGILFEQIMRSSKYVTSQKSDPSQFWAIVLKNNDQVLEISKKMELLIKFLLVTPFASAECERGFSVLTRIDADARNSLSPETIQHIIRIMVNGNPNIKVINAVDMAKAFLKHHIRVDDTSYRGGREKKPQSDFSFHPSQLF